STTIVSAYLNEIAIANTLLDVRTCIVTNADYRDAKVDWGKTQKKIVQRVTKKGITVTQGFLGAETANNVTTTLGREGSDYTAAIFAHCLNAGSVTIWKDVAGVLNADPRYFDNPTLLKHISYTEAMQLTFYGASVIHPKTLQPLQHKEIPLYVKSFFNPSQPGTRVGKGLALDPEVPCFVLKKEQVLISVSSPGFSFITEKQMGEVFRLLHTFKMKVAVVQSSAVRFSVCAANGFGQLGPLLAALRTTFKVSCHEGVTLCTVRRPGPGDCE
ncbi:MAG: aspartate kinase, partial [Marinirhabdus sp.]